MSYRLIRTLCKGGAQIDPEAAILFSFAPQSSFCLASRLRAFQKRKKITEHIPPSTTTTSTRHRRAVLCDHTVSSRLFRRPSGTATTKTARPARSAMTAGISFDPVERSLIAASVNLSVLRRSDASISAILQSASHVVLYEFSQDARDKDSPWRTVDVEGALFVVERRPPGAEVKHRLIIINRKSLNNYSDDLVVGNEKIELNDRMIMYHNSHGATVGIWFYEHPAAKETYDVLRKLLAGEPVPPAEKRTTIKGEEPPVMEPKEEQQPIASDNSLHRFFPNLKLADGVAGEAVPQHATESALFEAAAAPASAGTMFKPTAEIDAAIVSAGESATPEHVLNELINAANVALATSQPLPTDAQMQMQARPTVQGEQMQPKGRQNRQKKEGKKQGRPQKQQVKQQTRQSPKDSPKQMPKNPQQGKGAQNAQSPKRPQVRHPQQGKQPQQPKAVQPAKSVPQAHLMQQVKPAQPVFAAQPLQPVHKLPISPQMSQRAPAVSVPVARVAAAEKEVPTPPQVQATSESASASTVPDLSNSHSTTPKSMPRTPSPPTKAPIAPPAQISEAEEATRRMQQQHAMLQAQNLKMQEQTLKLQGARFREMRPFRFPEPVVSGPLPMMPPIGMTGGLPVPPPPAGMTGGLPIPPPPPGSAMPPAGHFPPPGVHPQMAMMMNPHYQMFMHQQQQQQYLANMQRAQRQMESQQRQQRHQEQLAQMRRAQQAQQGRSSETALSNGGTAATADAKITEPEPAKELMRMLNVGQGGGDRKKGKEAENREGARAIGAGIAKAERVGQVGSDAEGGKLDKGAFRAVVQRMLTDRKLFDCVYEHYLGDNA